MSRCTAPINGHRTASGAKSGDVRLAHGMNLSFVRNTSRSWGFTGRFECARRFGNDKDYLIICDTRTELEFDEEFNRPGNYVRTFYPLVDVLVKARDNGGFGFPESIFNYICEDEYIMRINLGNINKLKWIKK